jgi:hypothetical protein
MHWTTFSYQQATAAAAALCRLALYPASTYAALADMLRASA